MSLWTRAILMIASGLLSLSVAAEDPGRPTVTVFAASSLTNVLQELADTYSKSAGVEVKLSFAASSVLARQIESGAPADLYLSADENWMDELEARNLIAAKTRRAVAANRLALVARTGSSVQLKIEPHFKLAAALGKERLAIGDPASVPAGRYAREALTKLGVWSAVEHRTVLAENVRAALAFVARGEVPLGIVYETDARIDSNVRIVDLFPETSHAPIRYPLALTATARPEAAGFAQFVSGSAGQAAFRKYGFAPVP